MTLQMILEIVHIYTEEAPMEPAEFQLATLLVSQTLQALRIDLRTTQDVVNGAALHLRWIFPGLSTRVLNGMPMNLRRGTNGHSGKTPIPTLSFEMSMHWEYWM